LRSSNCIIDRRPLLHAAVRRVQAIKRSRDRDPSCDPYLKTSPVQSHCKPDHWRKSCRAVYFGSSENVVDRSSSLSDAVDLVVVLKVVDEFF